MPNHGRLPNLPTTPGTDPLTGYSADGITLEAVIAHNSSSRTWAAQRADGVRLQVWIADDHLTRDVAFATRFRQEADQLAGLRHVHVETCFGRREWPAPDGRTLLVLVSEASEGLSLGELARREALPVRDVLRVFQQACAGLAVAHRMGIVHGDLTPDAFQVTAGGTAKLRSFALGISGYSAERIERSLIGSPDFMAPEVGRGQQPSGLSDLYAIGAVLATVLTGEVPFSAATALETIHRQATAPVPDLAVSHPEFSAVAPLVSRLMAKDPATRWMDLDDLSRELLMLSGQISGEVRCRVWTVRRPVALANLVQSALAQRQDPVTPSPLPERATGGTTSITRKSVDIFKNPDLYKPSGLTPASGLPILSEVSNTQPGTRSVRRMEATAPRPSSTPALTPPVPPATSRIAVERSVAVATATAPVPASPASLTRSKKPLILVSALVVAAMMGVTAFVLSRGRSSAPLVPVATAVVSVERPVVVDPLAERIAAIIALSARDPLSAVTQGTTLRKEHPTVDPARLPAALRLVVQGPEAASLRITHQGEPVMVVGGVTCRTVGQPLSLRIEAAGYRGQDVLIPAAGPDELVQVVTMLDEPRWSLTPFAPTWVKLLPASDGALLVSDRKVVVLAATDGREIARLDHAKSALLPPDHLAWSAVLAVGDGRVRLGVSGGLCIDAETTGFGTVTQIHRGQASVLSLQVLPLTLRLGEEGIFSLERDGSGVVLAADGRERRLWQRPVNGKTPWFTGVADRLLVIEERQARWFTQEGDEVGQVALASPRTGEPFMLGHFGAFIPTATGVVRVTAKSTLLAVPGLDVPITALVGDDALVVAVGGRALATWRVDGEALISGWTQAGAAAPEHRLVHLALAGKRVVVADDLGVISVFDRADGRVVRTIHTSAPLLTAPLLVGDLVIVVQAPGVVCAF